MPVNDKSCPEQLDALRKEFDDFAYIIAHDFKAPLRAISNLSAWIEEDLGTSVPESVQENLVLLRNRTARLEQMIEALSVYARTTAAQTTPESTNVWELVEAAKNKASATRSLTVDVAETLPVFITYKEKLGGVLMQIIQNAATFGKADELILTVSVKSENDRFCFEVADNGGGVPDQVLDKLFNMFYTVASKDAVNTTGSGLTIARKTVLLAGGDMWAQNNEQGGLSVFFTWPGEIRN